jgi:hypothetical protein
MYKTKILKKKKYRMQKTIYINKKINPKKKKFIKFKKF